MASCIFVLSQGKRQCPSTIFVRIQGRNPYINIRQTTHLKVDAALWNLDRGSHQFYRFRHSEEGRFLFSRLREIELALNSHLNSGQPLSAAQTRSIINSILWNDVPAVPPMDLNTYAEQYLTDIEAGARLTERGTRFSPASVSTLKVSVKRFREYQEKRHIRLDFSRMDASVFNDYILFLQRQNYRSNYICKLISNLKTLLACATADGYPVHPACRNRISGIGMREVDSVYLTLSELDAIKSVDLSDWPEHIALSRDIFLIGVWTAQRVSDYNHLEKTSLRYDSLVRGERIPTLHIVQKKTHKKVVIPCSTELLSILKRYPDKLPSVPYFQLNRDIKTIARIAGIDDPIEVSACIGGVTQKKVLPKYALVRSHTARRTGATLMYLSGMNEFDICRITGHSSVKTLQRYIKADELETVRKLKTAYRYFD